MSNEKDPTIEAKKMLKIASEKIDESDNISKKFEELKGNVRTTILEKKDKVKEKQIPFIRVKPLTLVTYSARDFINIINNPDSYSLDILPEKDTIYGNPEVDHVAWTKIRFTIAGGGQTAVIDNFDQVIEYEIVEGRALCTVNGLSTHLGVGSSFPVTPVKEGTHQFFNMSDTQKLIILGRYPGKLEFRTS